MVSVAGVRGLGRRLWLGGGGKGAVGAGTGRGRGGGCGPGWWVCVVGDVVRSGGALLSAVEALRAAGLDVSAAICVVDRQEGGAEATAARGVRLASWFTVADLGLAPSPAAG